MILIDQLKLFFAYIFQPWMFVYDPHRVEDSGIIMFIDLKRNSYSMMFCKPHSQIFSLFSPQNIN